MSKIVKYTEFKKVVDNLWSKVKENFVTEVKYDSTSKKLKYTKNGQDTEITSVITKWGDLEYTTQSSLKNIFDKNTQVEVDKIYSFDSISPNPDWKIIKIPCKAGDEFTVVKGANHDSIQVGVYDINDRHLRRIDARQTQENGKRVYRFTIPNDLQNASYFVNSMNNNDTDINIVMVFKENVTSNNIPTNYIPFADGADVLINSNRVALSFDGAGTNLSSATIHSAIKELNKKIVSAGGGTVTRVNGQDPNPQGEVTVGIADIGGLQGQLDSKVVTVNQQQQQGGNVTLNGTHINATVGNNTTSIQEHLRLIGIKANDNDTRLIKLERKHPTYNVGDIVPTFKNSGRNYRIDGCEFMYCGVANSLNRTQYPDFCDVLGYPTNTARFDTPVIRDETIVIGNGKSVIKRYYICIKNS